MRTLHLGDAASPHLRRVVQALSERGVEQRIFTLNSGADNKAYGPGIRIVHHGTASRGGDVSKLRYLLALPTLRRELKAYKPDIVHAHYATSYGLLGALCGHRPLVISAWGSDVLLFPGKSPLHRRMLAWVLDRGQRVLVISEVLEQAVSRLTGTPITRAPFGVDTVQFHPHRAACPYFEAGTLVIGTIKSLEPVYRISVLLDAFREVVRSRPTKALGLLICGDGSLRRELEERCAHLGIAERVRFTGRLSPEHVPEHHAMIDVFANLSASESYGVSVLEAMSSARPVVASNVGGLPELVVQDVTGLLVAPDDVQATAGAIARLVDDASLRDRMGTAGRERVLATFDRRSHDGICAAVYKELVQHRAR